MLYKEQSSIITELSRKSNKLKSRDKSQTRNTHTHTQTFTIEIKDKEQLGLNKKRRYEPGVLVKSSAFLETPKQLSITVDLKTR